MASYSVRIVCVCVCVYKGAQRKAWYKWTRSNSLSKTALKVQKQIAQMKLQFIKKLLGTFFESVCSRRILLKFLKLNS